MSQTLKLPNFRSLNILEQTFLTTDVAAASASLPVQNTQDFTSGVYILIGTIGAKGNELILGNSTSSASSLPLSANTALIHKAFDTVYALYGNKLKIYRAPNVDGSQPADGSFSLVSGGTIDIDPNDSLTQFTDPTGSGDYWYKYTYYNSTTAAESDISTSTAKRGSFTANYCTLDDIRGEAGFSYAAYITDDMIDKRRSAAQDQINGALDGFYNTPFQPPINDHIRDITTRLAAGLLLEQQYGQTSPTGKEGSGKVKAAEADLDKLIRKERILVGKNGASLALPGSTGGAGGWPDQTTASTPRSQGGAPRLFRMGDIQGRQTNSDDSGGGSLYYGRKY